MEIKDLLKYKDKESFIKDFNNDRLIVRHKYDYPIIQFMMTSDNEKKFFLSSSISNPTEMSYIERTMTSLYNKYISMIESIANKVGEAIPILWRFVFMCAPDSLILKQVITGKNVIQDNDNLKFWSDLFGTKYNSTVYDSAYSTLQVPYDKLADILYDNDPSKKDRILSLLNITDQNDTDYYIIIKDKSDILITLTDKLDNVSKNGICNMNSEVIYIIFKDFIKYCNTVDFYTKAKSILPVQSEIQVSIDLIADTFVEFCQNGEFHNILESNELSKYDINVLNIHNSTTAEFLSKREHLRTMLKYIIKVLCTNYYTLRQNNIYDADFIKAVNTVKEKIHDAVSQALSDSKVIIDNDDNNLIK